MWLETWEGRCKGKFGYKNKLVKNQKLNWILVPLSISYRFQRNKTSSNTFHIAPPIRVWTEPSISSSVNVSIHPSIHSFLCERRSIWRKPGGCCRSAVPQAGKGRQEKTTQQKIRVWRIGEDLPVLVCARSCCGCERQGLLLLLCKLQQMITYIF
jgi:hypothetical protein